MPSILQLLNDLPSFNYYYGGYGNIVTKSIPFGDDEPGGGSSGQPFIQRSIGETWSPNNTDDGTMPLGIVGSTARSLADVERITKFFATPKGVSFLAKQVGLQLSNPQLEQPVQQQVASPNGNLFSDAVSLPSRISADVGTTRVYNLGVNTLAQVGAVAFGTHFYRHGLSPIMSDTDKYINVVAANNQINASSVSGSSGNRLLRLESQMFNSANSTIASYTGGPDSVYGVGSTTITRTVHTLGDADADQNSELAGFVPLKVSDLAKIGTTGILVVSAPNQSNPSLPSNASLTPQGSSNLDGTNSYDVNTTDFRLIKNALYNANLPFTDYVKLNMNTRIGVGDQGITGQSRATYWQPLQGTTDQINALSLFYSPGPPTSTTNIVDLNSGQAVTAASVRDIIKFRIESIDNDNPGNSIWMLFRAFINGFSDTFNSEWNSYKYTGRGERFYVYDGYVRQIGLGFTIAAKTRQEMKPLYQKLNYLCSTMTPDYNTANKMRGNITKLTVGDYMYRQPGIITELHIDTDNEFPWEIAIDSPEGGNDKDMKEVPMILKVSLTFVPIQSFLPHKGASTHFISVGDNAHTGHDWLNDTPANSATTPSTLASKVQGAQTAAKQANANNIANTYTPPK